MSYSQQSRAIRRTDRRRLERPWGVTLVACFQILKGGVLLFTAVMLRLNPDALASSHSTLDPLLFVAMRGNSSVMNAVLQGGDMLSGLVAIWGIYLGALGSGLWRMKVWARRSVMFTSGITFLLFAKATFFPNLADVSSPSPDLQNVHILLFFDVIIFAYLMSGNTAQSFQPAAKSI